MNEMSEYTKRTLIISIALASLGLGIFTGATISSIYAPRDTSDALQICAKKYASHDMNSPFCLELARKYQATCGEKGKDNAVRLDN